MNLLTSSILNNNNDNNRSRIRLFSILYLTTSFDDSESLTVKAKIKSRTVAANIKFMRINLGYYCTDYKTNSGVLNGLITNYLSHRENKCI